MKRTEKARKVDLGSGVFAEYDPVADVLRLSSPDNEPEAVAAVYLDAQVGENLAKLMAMIAWGHGEN